MEVGKNPPIRLSVAPRTRLLADTLSGCPVQGQAVSPCFVACCFRRTSDFGRRFAWFHVLYSSIISSMFRQFNRMYVGFL